VTSSSISVQRYKKKYTFANKIAKTFVSTPKTPPLGGLSNHIVKSIRYMFAEQSIEQKQNNHL
jgi:hypothetical protein